MKRHFKVLSTYILAFVMSALFVVSGCNRTIEETSYTDATDNETEVTESSYEETTDISDDIAKIDKWMDFYSDEVLNEIHKDKIMYTIHAKYNDIYKDLDFYLPVDIKTYVDQVHYNLQKKAQR